jgi:uncharacterized protein YkwD
MLDKINSARAKHGLRSLSAQTRLMRSADRYAGQLARNNVFRHGSIRLAGFRATGEMLATQRGRGKGTGSVVRMWLRSPGHRALMLSRVFRQAGIGRARGSGSTMWVVRLGAR